MYVPEIKKLKNIDPTQADTFKFEVEKGKACGIYRPRAAFQLPRGNQGALVVVAEQFEFRKPKKLYHLYEFLTDDAGLIFDKILELRHKLMFREIYARLTPPEINMLQFKNQELWSSSRKDISVLTPYPCDENGILDYQLTVLRGLTRAENTRLIFRAGTSLELELSNLPANSYNVKDDDYPLIAALCYGITSLITMETSDQKEQFTDRCKTEYDIFANM